VLADNPVAYWRLGETSGTTAVDEKGLYNGTYVNSPTLGVAGAIAANSAAQFNGTTQRITVADAAALRPTGAITVEAWIRFSVAQNNRGIVAKYSTGTSERAWALYVANDSVGRKVSFTIQTSGGTFNTSAVASSTDDLNDNAWHHVVCVFSPSATLRLYIDGVANPQASSIPASIFSSTATLEIAAYNQASNFFEGVIDEVAIYPTALSAERIAAHYAAANP
jgi:hypothetical protein